VPLTPTTQPATRVPQRTFPTSDERAAQRVAELIGWRPVSR